MKLWMDLTYGGRAPKRGDLIQTNVGDKRERTLIVIRATRRRCQRPCFNLWVERWWEIEPGLRNALYRSAVRHGGQRVFFFRRYKCTPRRDRFLDDRP